MAKVGRVKVELYPISLKCVAPAISKNDEKKKMLMEDLTKMSCTGLLLEPQALTSKAMVQDFQGKHSNIQEGTIQRDPEHQTTDSWAEVYNFRKEGRKRARRIEKWVDGNFETTINPKDGHAVSDCIDPKERRVLDFVIPILYLEKPNRVTKEVGNTVFGALSREYKVTQDQVLYEVVDKLGSVLGKGKPTLVSPYLFHLYSNFECLREEEIQQIEIARDCLELGVAPEGEPELDVVEIGLDRGSLSPREQHRGFPSSQLKTTYMSPKTKEPVWNTDWKYMSCLDFSDDPFQQVQDELDQIQNHYSKMEIVIKGVSKLLGDCKAGNICKELKKLKEKDTASLEAANATLSA